MRYQNKTTPTLTLEGLDLVTPVDDAEYEQELEHINRAEQLIRQELKGKE